MKTLNFIDHSKAVFLPIDLTNDSFPGGGLAVPNGHAVIEPTNRLVELAVANDIPIVFTRDWHRPDTKHFKPSGLWNPHNVQGTPGAEFHKDIIFPKGAYILSKGMGDEDAYSAWDPKADIEGLTLPNWLHKEKKKTLVFWGLATDYCVKFVVLDALKDGFEVIIITDAMVAVNPDDQLKAIKEMEDAGAYAMTVDELMTQTNLKPLN
jgi:nicotinamidase/pyrazinamidase